MRALVCVLGWAFVCLGGVSTAADKYGSYAELSRYEQEGKDYQIRWLYRASPVSFFAIHGGKIEFFTSELTRMAAGNEYNAYFFEGMKADDNWDLHITSHKFDEPNGLRMAALSKDCISFHGFRENRRRIVCIGANNTKLGAKIAASLRAARLPLEVQIPCDLFPGTYNSNIVNRCANEGVQLELSGRLRGDLRDDPNFADAFIAAIRSAMPRKRYCELPES